MENVWHFVVKKQQTTFFNYNRTTTLQTSMCADGHSQIHPSTIQSPCIHIRRFKSITQFLQLEYRLWYKYMAFGRNNRQHPYCECEGNAWQLRPSLRSPVEINIFGLDWCVLLESAQSKSVSSDHSGWHWRWGTHTKNPFRQQLQRRYSPLYSSRCCVLPVRSAR